MTFTDQGHYQQLNVSAKSGFSQLQCLQHRAQHLNVVRKYLMNPRMADGDTEESDPFIHPDGRP